MNRRAFLAAIAGAIVAPHVRAGARPEPVLLVTGAWLATILEVDIWSVRAAAQLHGYRQVLTTDAWTSFLVPLTDVRKLALSFADSMHREIVETGFVGV